MAAALATLALASPSFSYIAMADAPMIAYGAAGLLSIRRGSLAAGSVLLGLAACTKNEGLVLIAAAAVAMLFTERRRDVLRLWPALAVAAPWLILRAIHALPTDLGSGALTERVAENLARLPGALRDAPPDHPVFWAAIVLTFVLFARRLGSERFLLITAALQLLAYLAAYAITPHDVRWHVWASWPRLMQHMAVPLAFAAIMLAWGPRTRSAGG